MNSGSRSATVTSSYFTSGSAPALAFVLLGVLSGLFPAFGGEPNEEGASKTESADVRDKVTQGALRFVKKDGTLVECPLKHTDVKADVSGFIARVRVKQTFHNPTQERIEAVYVFPLPHKAAVDEMTMVIGERRIVGVIKRREEARQIYEEALQAGKTAALLEQERPNIFTQSVGNIDPGQEIDIEISYVDVLDYDMGSYEFHFPMVVGPRYVPGKPTGSAGPRPKELQGKVSPPVANTDRVPDASRISPPVLKPEYRNGHDISLSVSLDAGVPVQTLEVANHRASVERGGKSRATVKLSPKDSLPNKDFVLRYDVVGEKPEMAVLAHTAGEFGNARPDEDGYFLLMIQPGEDERLTKNPPREIVFLVDVSGSMSGKPTAKVRETMQHMLGFCRKKDTVQVVTFSSRASRLFKKPVSVTDKSIGRAVNFTRGLRGSGGTEMLKGVRMAVNEPLDPKRLRIVVLLTDGYIGNEAEIIEHVGENCGDRIRFWTIGIGSSPNMFLVDGVAKQGGGMGKRLGLEDDSEALSREVMTRIQRAQLADVAIDWGDFDVAETYPTRIPELWAGRPVVLFGRYRDGGRGEITVKGTVEGDPVSWPLQVRLPDDQPEHDVLAKVWARHKIENLMHQSFYAGSPAVEEEVTSLALDYRLMSQYTSFVAVDEKDAEDLEAPARPPRRMLVPVPLPEGTRWEGFFGEERPVPRRRADLRLGEDSESRPAFYGRRPARLTPGIKTSRPATRRAGAQAAESQSFARNFSDFSRAKSGGWKYRKAQKKPGQAYAAGPRLRQLPQGGFGGGGGFGQPVAKPPQVAVEIEAFAETYADIAEDHDRGLRELATTALRSNATAARDAARKARSTAKQLREDGKQSAARRELLRAFFLDTAAANLHRSNGRVAAEALAGLEEMRREQVAEWSETVPALKTKLDFVIRDESLAGAIRWIGEAAGLNIALMPGSVADASDLLPDAPRVTYLDLRGATVAQALDWLLRPARMNWWVDEGRIVAGTQRRHRGISAWVYDVAPVALPLKEELDEPNDRQKVRDAAGKAAERFLAAVREPLGLSERDVTWYAPGQLLVFGERRTQAEAAELIAALADPDAKVAADLQPLHKLTSRRAQRRKDDVAERRAAERRANVAAAHARFGWQLLAAAAAGELDAEALTELQIAWRRSETGKLLDGESAPLVLRSLWAVTEASRALPEETELSRLARQVRQAARDTASRVLESLEQNSEDRRAFTGVLYAALALRDDAAYLDRAESLLLQERGPDDPLSAAAAVAEALLAEAGSTDADALTELVEQGVRGEDMLVLTALACRRAEGRAWNRFRAEADDLLGKQPLPGHVVVLVNRLAVSRLPLIAAQNRRR